MDNIEKSRLVNMHFEEATGIQLNEEFVVNSTNDNLNNSVAKIKRVLNDFAKSMPEDIHLDFDGECTYDSNLDKWDYCYALAIGVAGVEIATSEKFANLLEGIHNAASETGDQHTLLQKVLGKLLHHKGDAMDIAEGEAVFIDRSGEHAYGAFHRVFWGHDILDFGTDNPFALMIQQEGIKGVIQAVRHLLADTMSKQGLPMPGSSYFDTQGKGNSLSNYLVQISQSLSREAYGNKGKANQIFSHLFTIRAQDFASGVVVKTMTQLYFLLRGIKDPIRCKEIELIAYTINFFGEAIKGMIKQNGVPYINVPVGAKMVLAFGRFIYLNELEDCKLSDNTNLLIKNTEELIENEKKYAALTSTLNTTTELIDSFDLTNKNIDNLLDFLNEE